MNTQLEQLIHRQSALFLDFDGTLADIAPRPDAVRVDPSVVQNLQRLHAQLNGAVAIITGRSLNEIRTFLYPLTLAGAYEHGAIRQGATGDPFQEPTPPLETIRAAAQNLVQRHPRLLVEQKSSGVAVHYRQAPELHGEVIQVLTQLTAHDNELQLLQGKAVLEIKSAHVGKGPAIKAFMQEAPFLGRTPVFIGDDVTDESGFEAVQNLGGTAIKIGEGATAARHRMPTPSALRLWLQSTADHLETTP
ncbi:trehalose-phosphatase [Hydrogenophaga sp. PAMC20947]|uniref:trehalose-phosphatase n=1 Tax=Hydrogenophaga sp. PAMC20947 TaxID=2565558 RepID=UPI001FF9B90C|nr:trehalose-phosphatase [Hydrogenophaga sp. PAMC20947]